MTTQNPQLCPSCGEPIVWTEEQMKRRFVVVSTDGKYETPVYEHRPARGCGKWFGDPRLKEEAK